MLSSQFSSSISSELGITLEHLIILSLLFPPLHSPFFLSPLFHSPFFPLSPLIPYTSLPLNNTLYVLLLFVSLYFTIFPFYIVYNSPSVSLSSSSSSLRFLPFFFTLVFCDKYSGVLL